LCRCGEEEKKSNEEPRRPEKPEVEKRKLYSCARGKSHYDALKNQFSGRAAEKEKGRGHD